jgi:hypothetical protein
MYSPGNNLSMPQLHWEVSLPLSLVRHLSLRSCHNASGFRYVLVAARPSQCGWCGNIDSNPTQGICVSQSAVDSNRDLCRDWFRAGVERGYGCDPIPNGSFLAFLIGMSVYGAATFFSSCGLAYVVKKRRNGSLAQVACWFFIGIVFSLFAWYMLQCWGPKPRDHTPHQQQNTQLPLEFVLGSAPPASASVEAAVALGFNAQSYPGPGPSAPPPFNPHAFPAPHAAPAYAPLQWQNQDSER